MAEVSLKRHRDAADVDIDGDCTETQPHILDSESEPKKQKSINQILSILEQDEDEADQDLTFLMSSLENEIICTIDFDSLPIDDELGVEGSTPSTSPESKSTADDDEKERVIRHLLEASDDELGLPASKSTDEIVDGIVIDGGDSFGFCDGLWELEDEAANYYTLLQSELFM